MLTVLAHAGHPGPAHGLWSRWDLDAMVLLVLIAAAVLYIRGRSHGRRTQRGADVRFTLGLVAVALALQGPVDALASELASAHMVQHVLLILVAPPLLTSPSVARTIARGIARPLRARAAVAVGRIARPSRLRAQAAALPLAAAAAAGSMWLWHIPVMYEAALRSDLVHALEHGTLLGAALWFWWLVLGKTRVGARSAGAPVPVLFAMAMQSVFLSLLLTFAPAPWYDPYRATAPHWGWEALADQHLAGVIMWVPAGMIYIGAALTLLVQWLSAIERTTRASHISNAVTGDARVPAPDGSPSGRVTGT